MIQLTEALIVPQHTLSKKATARPSLFCYSALPFCFLYSSGATGRTSREQYRRVSISRPV